ncbi:MAG: substrate-binding domain-containing protein, partial [Bacteroidales bacterium]|nr:substrate-binding domain-containing protein [Bacteroidales bacterium]
MTRGRILIPGIFILLTLLAACVKSNNAAKDPAPLHVPELIIYCENGIVAPIYEISQYFEIRYRCKVSIQNGNVRNLTSMISLANNGDLFIPDTNYGFSLLRERLPEIINDSLYIGTNQLIYIIPRGNPEKFDGQLESMGQKKYAVIIANPETSSLGHKTKEILKNKAIYSQVINNIMTLSVDNRGLIRSINGGEATLAIDWISSYYYNSNREKVDSMHFAPPIPESDIFASVLSTSKNPGLAQTFLAVLSSPQAVEIFKAYGIKKKRSGII